MIVFFRKLRDFSKVAMELDYKNYDQNMPVDIGWASATIVERLCKHLGYNDEAMVYVRGCLSDSLHPMVIMLGDVFSSPGLQPSGKAYTAEDNSLRQLVMLLYAWLSNEDTRNLDFFEFVMPVTYGDDLLAPIKESIVPVFNNNVYTRLCKELYGMTCTDSAKSSDMADVVPIQDGNFLKRNCKYRCDLNRFCGVLELDSVYKSLEWYMPSPYVTAYEQLTSTLQSTMRELFFYIGRDVYTEIRRRMISVLALEFEFVSPNWFEDKIPQYDTLFLEFDRSSVQEDDGKLAPSYVVQSRLSLNLESINIETQPRLEVAVRNSTLKFRTTDFNNITLRFLDSLKEELKEAETVLDSVPPPAFINDYYDPTLDPSYKIGSDYKDIVDKYTEARNNVRTLKITIDMLEANIAKARTIKFVSQSGEQSDGNVNESLIANVENLSDVAGDVPDVKDAGWAMSVPTFSSVPVELGDFLQRPVSIFSFTTAPGTKAVQTIDPWSLYFNAPSVRAKLKNFAFIRATLNVRIAVAGTPFHALQAIVTYVPQPSSNEIADRYARGVWTTRDSRPAWMSQGLGAKVMQVRDNMPLDITIPFVHCVPAAALWRRGQTTAITAGQSYDSIPQMGRLCIHSPAALVDVAPVPTNVSWYIYAHLSDVELGCPTKTVVELTTESDERKVGPVEKASASMAEVASGLVPVFGIYAKASSVALGALSKVSSLFGWSYPIMNTEPQRIKNEPYQNAAHVSGYSLGQKISLDPKHELTVDPRIGGVNVDELALEHLCSIPSYITTFQWSTSGTSAIPKMKLPVYPKLAWWSGSVGTSETIPTATGFAAMPFRYWRGKIHFRFDVICTQFHRGKLAFVFEPNVQQNVLIDSSGLQLNKQFLCTLDIQESQSIEICVDWASSLPWLRCDHTALISNGNLVIDSARQEWYNGYISVYPMVQLQGPDVETISINVYMKSSDMHFNYFQPGLLPTLSLQSDEQREDHTCIMINPCGASTKSLNDMNFGESVVSLRPLLKRFSVIRQYQADVPTTGTSCIKIFDQIYPPLEPRFGMSVQTPEPLLLNYLRMAFMGMRGSMRFRITGRHVDLQTLSAIRVEQEPPNDTYTNGIFANSQITHSARGSLMFVPHTNGGIEFELPFYSALYFVGAGILNSAFDVNAVPNTFCRNFNVQIDTSGNFGASTQAQFTVYCATGEDFSLFRFYGATPIMVIV
jgi:hypothetical protein